MAEWIALDRLLLERRREALANLGGGSPPNTTMIFDGIVTTTR